MPLHLLINNKFFLLAALGLLALFSSSGVATAQSYYNSTGGNQSYTVPAGVNCIYVKMWGAGGGGGDNGNGGDGGGGAYVAGYLTVTPGETLTLVVGSPGARGEVNSNGDWNGSATFGGGGVGRRDNRGGGNGGGMTAIYRGGTLLAVAGGGGGGGGSGSNGGDGNRYQGGGAAGVGGTGQRGGDRDGLARGSGGCGGTPTSGQNCTNGQDGGSLFGGNGENLGNTTYGAGGGGGGYFGGEGGNSGGNNSGGGGGGSSFFSGNLAGTASANYEDAGNAGDGDNGGNYGRGGTRGNYNAQGGRLVVYTVGAYVPGSLTINGSPSNATVCINSTVAITQGTGQQINGGGYYYCIGFDANNSGWIDAGESWTVCGGPGYENVFSVNSPVLNQVGQWVIHTNGFNACSQYGPGTTRYVQVINQNAALAGTLLANGQSGNVTVDAGTTVNFTRSGGTYNAHYYIADHTNAWPGWDICNDNCHTGNSFSRQFNQSGQYLIRLHPEVCGLYNWNEASDIWLTVRPRPYVETKLRFDMIGNPDNTTLTANAFHEINRNLVMHLPFNGNYSDVSGNNHNAQPGGGNPLFTEDRHGNHGRAIQLNGTSDFLQIPTLLNLSGDEITISYWFKGSSTQSAVRQQSGAGYLVAGWGGQHILSHDGGTGGLSHGNATDGNWHHLVLTWQREYAHYAGQGVTKFSSYLDGNLVAQRNSVAATIPNMNSPVYIGCYNDGVNPPSEFTNGILDDIRIYRKALTQTEVRQLYGDYGSNPHSNSYSYTWSPGTGLSSISTKNVTASPTSTQTYVASATTGGGPVSNNGQGDRSSTITVVNKASVSINGGTIHCGTSPNTTLSVAGSQANLVAHYPLTSNLNDISGSNLHLSGSGGTITASGLQMTTSSVYQSVSTGILNTDTYTFAFYLRFDALPDGFWRKIFGYNAGGSDRTPGLWKYPTDMRLHWRHDPGNTGIDEAPYYELNRWHHVAGVKNGATFTLYIDGIAVYSGAVANPKTGGNAALVFGAAPVTIREVKIFNRALSAADVNATRAWTWSSGTCNANNLGTGTSVTVAPTSTTTYYVSDLISSINGNYCSGQTTITVNPLPTATISNNSIAEVCVGTAAQNITFTGANGTPPYTFTYNINGGGNQTVSTIGSNTSISVPISTATKQILEYNLLSVKDSSPTECSQNQSGQATINVTFPVSPTLNSVGP